MQLIADDISTICSDRDVYTTRLALDNCAIVELGCGTAMHTHAIASEGVGRSITAFEVDETQLAINVAANQAPNVRFAYGGAEKIACADASTDVVFMFKSLHHVPHTSLTDALKEVHRILKPGGHVYISEPLFAGPLNDIIRLFHDEQQVRKAAYTAVRASVASGVFELAEQVFFLSPVQFENFAQFDERLLKATHTDFQLNDETLTQVREKLESNIATTGSEFLAPMRVDLLRRPT